MANAENDRDGAGVRRSGEEEQSVAHDRAPQEGAPVQGRAFDFARQEDEEPPRGTRDPETRHDSHDPLARDELSEALLTGAPIYGAGDQRIGTISHVHGEGAITDVVVDIGAFLGTGPRPVLLSVDQLNLMRDEAGRVHGLTAWTREQLEALPGYRG